MKIRKYLMNCFILLIPIFIWNIVFVKLLPKPYSAEVFWKDIPSMIVYVENILRILVFSLPLIMSLSLKTKLQKKGLMIYAVGIVLYFLSWSLQIYFPDIRWSKGIFGFMAPAYTTIIWFVGIGLIGDKSIIRIPHISAIYISFSILFVVFHTLHAYLVFIRF